MALLGCKRTTHPSLRKRIKSQRCGCDVFPARVRDAQEPDLAAGEPLGVIKEFVQRCLVPVDQVALPSRPRVRQVLVLQVVRRVLAYDGVFLAPRCEVAVGLFAGRYVVAFLHPKRRGQVEDDGVPLRRGRGVPACGSARMLSVGVRLQSGVRLHS